ncbi:MAG: hypothetical protein KDA75_12235 [Planctomycetaceae bacterium]|nr:hypothetical protein [Planctomycetaceae bacterium]
MVLGYRGETGGVLVTRLPAGADENGLELYDVIEEVSRKPVDSVEEFARLLADSAGEAPVVLKVRRLVDGEVQHLLVVVER